MEEFSDIFTDQPGCTRLAEHAIQLNSNKPIRVKPYPIPFAKVSDIEREVYMMLKLGVIEPSKSPYSCPLLLVKKPDGSNRPVVDSRQRQCRCGFLEQNSYEIIDTVSRLYVLQDC